MCWNRWIRSCDDDDRTCSHKLIGPHVHTLSHSFPDTHPPPHTHTLSLSLALFLSVSHKHVSHTCITQTHTHSLCHTRAHTCSQDTPAQRQTDRQTDRQRQTDRHTHSHTRTHTHTEANTPLLTSRPIGLVFRVGGNEASLREIPARGFLPSATMGFPSPRSSSLSPGGRSRRRSSPPPTPIKFCPPSLRLEISTCGFCCKCPSPSPPHPLRHRPGSALGANPGSMPALSLQGLPSLSHLSLHLLTLSNRVPGTTRFGGALA